VALAAIISLCVAVANEAVFFDSNGNNEAKIAMYAST
jgi:hypothetical protein